MRKTYQYNKKSDKQGAYGHDAAELLNHFVHWDDNGSYFSDHRSIEQQINAITEATGKLCDVLVSKGLMTHDEFLEILNLKHTHEARNNTW